MGIGISNSDGTFFCPCHGKQVVVSGDAKQIEKFCEYAKKSGVKRVVNNAASNPDPEVLKTLIKRFPELDLNLLISTLFCFLKKI